MKCPACGYTREVKIEQIQEATLFKSGPRKGKFKEVVSSEVKLEVGHADFEEVRVITGLAESYGADIAFDSATVLVCPECSTMIWGQG